MYLHKLEANKLSAVLSMLSLQQIYLVIVLQKKTHENAIYFSFLRLKRT